MSPCQVRGVNVQDLVLGNVNAVQLCCGKVFPACDLVEHAEVLATLGVETSGDNGHEIQVTDAGLEVAGSERPTGVEPDDVSDRMHGVGEGHHDGRLVEALIHRISMTRCRRPAQDPLEAMSIRTRVAAGGSRACCPGDPRRRSSPAWRASYGLRSRVVGSAPTHLYLLLVEWDRLKDHTEGFRSSYEPFPVVEHYEQVYSA